MDTTILIVLTGVFTSIVAGIVSISAAIDVRRIKRAETRRIAASAMNEESVAEERSVNSAITVLDNLNKQIALQGQQIASQMQQQAEQNSRMATMQRELADVRIEKMKMQADFQARERQWESERINLQNQIDQLRAQVKRLGETPTV